MGSKNSETLKVSIAPLKNPIWKTDNASIARDSSLCMMLKWINVQNAAEAGAITKNQEHAQLMDHMIHQASKGWSLTYFDDWII